MSVMIQIRNVPGPLHRALKSRAALAGMSLSDFLIGLLQEAAERPTVDELRTRLAARESESLTEAPAAAVHAERDAR
jgi:plasmid stability protein